MTTSTTTNCTYCGQPVPDEYDGETGQDYNLGFHWACSQDDPTGEWIVRTTQNAVTPARVNERRFASQKRAREVATQTRNDNRREWVCGRDLDIIVVQDRPAL